MHFDAIQSFLSSLHNARFRLDASARDVGRLADPSAGIDLTETLLDARRAQQDAELSAQVLARVARTEGSLLDVLV